MISHYLHIWLRFTIGSFQVATVSRLGAALFMLAKLLRFIFFFLVVFLVMDESKTLAGYSIYQTILFFLTFNVIDTTSQLLFRDVYRFRYSIISGYFDYILIKPMSPLFKVLFGGADLLDLIMLVPYLGLLLFVLLQATFSFYSIVFYLLLILNAFLISAAFHIFVLALGILTTDIDHAIMIYRDISSMARFPVDIYREPLRGFITFIIPIGVMMTFPPKALFSLLSPGMITVAFIIGGSLLFLSLLSWKYALARYTSASS